MSKFRIIFGLCLVAGVAFAVKQSAFDAVNSPRPQWFQSGVIVGDLTDNPVASTNNTVQRINCTILDYDFPALARGACQTSSDKTFVLTGARLGDPCFLGVGAATPSDGGSGYAGDSEFVCNVASNNRVKIRHCAILGYDAGLSSDPADAGFNVCAFSTARRNATGANNGE